MRRGYCAASARRGGALIGLPRRFLCQSTAAARLRAGLGTNACGRGRPPRRARKIARMLRAAFRSRSHVVTHRCVVGTPNYGSGHSPESAGRARHTSSWGTAPETVTRPIVQLRLGTRNPNTIYSDGGDADKGPSQPGGVPFWVAPGVTLHHRTRHDKHF